MWLGVGSFPPTASQFTPEGVPDRRFLVGGRFDVEYRAPSEGTLYWVEDNTKTIIATKSVDPGTSVQFQWVPEFASLLGDPNRPSSVKLSLYFVPNQDSP
ncbi:MAG: hypothetical protein QHH07_00130 [Sedimentisphaerales bacterium]|nr:hypothetical protein [Sedimentisphaerales bacterium]